MTMFKPKQEKIQNEMFEAELQQGREQGVLDYDARSSEQEMVALQQKKENEDLTRWQQDMEGELNLVVHRLKRQRYDENTEDWVQMPGEFTGRKDEKGNPIYKPIRPMMNDLGINFFITSSIPSLSRNLMMSNYDEEKIYTRLRRIIIQFIHHLGYHHKEYDIDEGDLSSILDAFKSLIEPAHWRALNNGERNFLNSTSRRIEAHAYGQQQQQKPKGFLSGLLG